MGRNQQILIQPETSLNRHRGAGLSPRSQTNQSLSLSLLYFRNTATQLSLLTDKMVAHVLCLCNSGSRDGTFWIQISRITWIQPFISDLCVILRSCVNRVCVCVCVCVWVFVCTGQILYVYMKLSEEPLIEHKMTLDTSQLIYYVSNSMIHNFLYLQTSFTLTEYHYNNGLYFIAGYVYYDG